MEESQRLQKNTDFKKVYARGKSLANYYMVLFFLKNGRTYNRVGFSASKKVGNSVVRNRARRLLKESFRHHSENIKEGYDIVFLARFNIKDATCKKVEKAMLSTLKKSKLLK
jgi:ribonuclease P protein component